MQSPFSIRFSAVLGLFLFLLLASELVHSKTINVNPKSTATAAGCGSLSRACKTLKAALNVAVDGDIISLSAGIHPVAVSIVLDKNIHITIQGKGLDLTTLQLSAGVLIDLYQVHLSLFDCTVSGGLGISVSAMANILDIVNIDINLSVNLDVNIARVKFENCVGGLKLYAPDVDLFGVFGSINAVVDACVFVGIFDEVAVTIGTRVDVTFSACQFLDNLNGVLRIFGDSNNFQCPLVRLDACVFVGNQANTSLIVAGTVDCNDLVVFVGLNVFQNNVAKVLLGYLDIALGWNYGCEDCEFQIEDNQCDSNCGTICIGSDCSSPPAFPGVDVDICLAGINIDLSLPLNLPLPALPVQIPLLSL